MSNEGQGWLDHCSQLSAKLPTQQMSTFSRAYAAHPFLADILKTSMRDQHVRFAHLISRSMLLLTIFLPLLLLLRGPRIDGKVILHCPGIHRPLTSIIRRWSVPSCAIYTRI